MPRDIEAELRQSLQARANDVSPDAALFARIQARLHRGRNVRLAFAGVAAALAVAGVAVAAPAVMNRRVEFEPAPVATQPGAASEQPTEATAVDTPVGDFGAPVIYTDGVTAYRDGPEHDSVMASPPGGMKSVAARWASSTEAVTVVAQDGRECSKLWYGQRVEAPAAGQRPAPGPGTPITVGTGCAGAAVFSPDGVSLAWVVSTPDGWSVQTVDWSDDGPGDEDASFGLPWPSDQPVEIQDWVWTEVTASTAKGHLVVRTQREGAWMVLRLPVERQADGALAVSLQPQPIGGMTGAFTPVAFASGGGDYSRDEDITYVMEIDMAPGGIERGRIVRRVGAEGGGVLDLPPELFNNTNPPFDVADLWMSASGDTVVYGNSGQQMAWAAQWDPQGDVGFVRLEDDIVRADLLGEVVGESAEQDAAATEPAAALTEVDVYFGGTGAGDCTADQNVTRTVEGPGVARAALTELLKGPSSRESNEGITSPFSAKTAGALNDITIVEGQARVDFADFRKKVQNDQCTKTAVVDALNKTLTQFPSIVSWRYSINGDVGDFEAWVGTLGEFDTEEPPLAVTETRKAIYAAAKGHDWKTLRRLSKGTSCTLSDEPEPCVPYWKEQEANGEDPLGTIVELLAGPAAQDPDAPMWVWPEDWVAPRSNYSGPRIGITKAGRWAFYQQEGG